MMDPVGVHIRAHIRPAKLKSALREPRVVAVRADEQAPAQSLFVDSTVVDSIVVDSAVFRRNGRAISIFSAGSRLSRTRVDTTLSSAGPAVELGANTILESTLIRGSSKHGLLLRSSAVQRAALFCRCHAIWEAGPRWPGPTRLTASVTCT